MPFSWKRPQSELFPLKYLQFEALDTNDSIETQKCVNFVIQDLESNRFEDVIKIMREKHLKDEPMYSSKRIPEDPVAFQEMTDNWRNLLQQKISLVCFKEGSEEIVAVNILGVVDEAEFDAPHSVKSFSISSSL